MDERGAGVTWHELEEVPRGQEQVPGLLQGLLTPGQRRSSWRQLEKLLGWRTTEPLFVEATARLFELLPELDVRRRARVLEYLARRAYWTCKSAAGVHRPAFIVFTEGRRHVLPLVADASAPVRARAAWLLNQIGRDDPPVLEALRNQASAETDDTALACQLLAVAQLSEADGPAASARWPRPWLDHDQAHIRLAAASATLAAAGPGGAEGTGRRIAEAFAALGTDPLPELPWWPAARTPIEDYALRLAPHPREGAALVDGLARHPDPALREDAVRAAGVQLRYWRSPEPGLWETVAAGLADEEAVCDASLEVLAASGAAAARYADPIVGAVAHLGPDGGSTRLHRAIRALLPIDDPRALPWYCAQFGTYGPAAGTPPERWAPHLLPDFRDRIAGGPTARALPEVLRILADWGPTAAPAVPELADLLDTHPTRAVAEALGRIGPAAAPAAEALASLALGEVRPEPLLQATGYAPRPWHGMQTAAWAHWRVTGDPELALHVGGAAARAGLGRPVLRYLADLGPLAAPYADAVRALLVLPGEWSRVGAAEAWWRITGDAAPAVGTLLPELRPLAAHETSPLVLRTVRALGAIGRPAAQALPTLRAVVGSERRYGASIRPDEELYAAAREALEHIEGP